MAGWWRCRSRFPNEAALLTFQVAPVELVQSLRRDDAILLGSEPGGDLLPCPALLALFADKVRERFKAAVNGRPPPERFFRFTGWLTLMDL